MSKFDTMRLPEGWDEMAPDGSKVRKLLTLDGGGMAHFELPPDNTSTAEVHPAFDEIWYFLSGQGQLWRKIEDHEELVEVEAGVCLTIPRKTVFQFRSFEGEPLRALGVTMPPWTGVDSVESVDGKWEPTAGRRA